MAGICVYYDASAGNILDIIPHDLDDRLKAEIARLWQQPVIQKILKTLSANQSMTISSLAKELGHSASTIHENISKLEQAGIIKTEISYEKKKQRIISTNVLFATKSSKFKAALSKFFQGLWVSSDDTGKIIEYLQKNKTKKLTVAEISAGTKIPVDRVEIALSNWDSVTTRGVSQLMKEPPFVKEVTYQAKS